MSYRILDIEITQPLPVVTLEAHESGIGTLVRQHGRPVCFWMEERAPGTSISPEELALLLSRYARAQLLRESVRSSITSPTSVPPDSEWPSLTIAICTKDRATSLERCLRSLVELSSVRVHPELEVLVVDNAPSDESTRHVAERFAESKELPLRYLLEPRPGLDFARNRALHEANGEILAFLDDDVVVDRGWLDALLATWAQNPDAGAVTGLILPLELKTPAQISLEMRGGFRQGMDHGFSSVRYEPQMPSIPRYPCEAGIFGAGANMAFRRELVCKLGGFDEALDTGRPLPGGGDLDMFYRVVRAGYPLIYEPSCLVHHEHRRDERGLRRQHWSWGAGFMAFAAKSYRQDRKLRAMWRQTIAWWFVYQWQQWRTGAVPPVLALSEIWGGLQGLLGEYSRSQRRIAEIRRAFASTPSKR